MRTPANGAVVVEAKVTVTNLDNGEAREVKTTSEGNYTVPELKAAPYKLTVEAPVPLFFALAPIPSDPDRTT